GARRRGWARALRSRPRRADGAPVRLYARDRLEAARGPGRRLAERARPRAPRVAPGRDLRRLGHLADGLRRRARPGDTSRLQGGTGLALPLWRGDGATGLRDGSHPAHRPEVPARPRPRRLLRRLRPLPAALPLLYVAPHGRRSPLARPRPAHPGYRPNLPAVPRPTGPHLLPLRRRDAPLDRGHGLASLAYPL
ncbi:MAG: hypothetical protein AVDCRST_MAG02-3734, partial [uncultured Rubrobacteraceae bacterium]